jgi:hypothetical protein
MKKHLGIYQLAVILSLVFMMSSCSNDTKTESQTDKDSANSYVKDSVSSNLSAETIAEIAIDEDIDVENDTAWTIVSSDSIQINTGLESIKAKYDTVPAVNDIIRIEGVATRSWKGVKGCCDEKSSRKNAKMAIEQWVGMHILAHPNDLYYQSGIRGLAVKAKCKSKVNKWTQERSCKGSYNQPYFIEFIKGKK